MPGPYKVGFISLGCPKNLVDSEVMMGQLVARGHQLTPNPAEADVLVVNTCSFIDPAKKESVETILEMAEYKKSGRARKLIVAGCLVERYRDDIRSQIPEVDAVIGTNDLESIVADRTAAADARFSGSRLARFRFCPRRDVREQVLAGESVLALLDGLEVGRQLAGTERGPLLYADVVLEEERQVNGDDVPNGWRPVHYTVKPVDPGCLGLIEPHVP